MGFRSPLYIKIKWSLQITTGGSATEFVFQHQDLSFTKQTGGIEKRLGDYTVGGNKASHYLSNCVTVCCITNWSELTTKDRLYNMVYMVP